MQKSLSPIYAAAIQDEIMKRYPSHTKTAFPPVMSTRQRQLLKWSKQMTSKKKTMKPEQDEILMKRHGPVSLGLLDSSS
jgi:predicted GIY-YIG superfamily endonuclease